MIWTLLGTLGVVAAVIAAGIVVDRKFGILPRPKQLREAGQPGHKLPAHAPGDAAQTALATPPRQVRCRACHATALLDDESPATYGDRALRVQRYRCTRCATTRTIYVIA